MIIFIALFLFFIGRKLCEFNKIYHFTWRVFFKFLLKRDIWNRTLAYHYGLSAIMVKALSDKNLQLPDSFNKEYFRNRMVKIYNNCRKIFLKHKPIF